MGLAPNIVKKKSFLIKECSRCHQKFGPENFAPVRSLFFDDGVLPICNECVKTFLVEKD